MRFLFQYGQHNNRLARLYLGFRRDETHRKRTLRNNREQYLQKLEISLCESTHGSNPILSANKKRLLSFDKRRFFERCVPLLRNVMFASQVMRPSVVTCACGHVWANVTSLRAKRAASFRSVSGDASSAARGGPLQGALFFPGDPTPATGFAAGFPYFVKMSMRNLSKGVPLPVIL